MDKIQFVVLGIVIGWMIFTVYKDVKFILGQYKDFDNGFRKGVQVSIDQLKDAQHKLSMIEESARIIVIVEKIPAKHRKG